MIENLDEQLEQWAKSISGGETVSFDAPRDMSGTLQINLYLLDLVEDPLRQAAGPLRPQPALRYLVTVYADDARDAHRVLGRLLQAALFGRDPLLQRFKPEVVLEPLSSHIWSAFSIAPRPGFILQVPLPIEPAAEPFIPVVGLKTESVDMVSLFGQVLANDTIPLAEVRVELPNLYRFASTDARGRFRLDGVPAAPKIKTLRVIGKGKDLSFDIAETGSDDEPVKINIPL